MNDKQELYAVEKGDRERFNRFTITYVSDKPVKVWVKYGADENEDHFFVEAGEGIFSGLIPGFLDCAYRECFTSIRAEACDGGEAHVTLRSLSTEMVEVPEKTSFVENERLKLGIALHWGGTISYLENKHCPVEGLANVVGRHDTGRVIQQSWYGTGPIPGVYDPGSSFGMGWKYNPVQGGDQFQNGGRLIDLKITDNAIYIKSQPRDWALNGSLAPFYTENTYTLMEDHVRVDNRAVDFMGVAHPHCDQEIPALYTVSYLDTFVMYSGDHPWTGEPLTFRRGLPFWGDASKTTFVYSEPNTETWCAWINENDGYGLGLYVPNVDEHKAGRHKFDGSKDDMSDTTNYVAPMNLIRMISFQPIEFSYLLTVDSLSAIRDIFTANKDFAENAHLHRNWISHRVPTVNATKA